MKARKQNILIIMSDQHHKGVMGCAGDGLVRTPHLDALAARGARLTNAYAAAPLCVPSRMSFMTSRMPSRNRVWSETPLPSGSPTLAHVMTLAGYETALIGRMHYVGQDQLHGFETRPIGEFSARYPGTKHQGGQPWKHYPSASAGQFRAGLEASGHGYTFYQYFDEQVTETACRYLAEKSGKQERPFCAVVGMVLPHCPYIAPKDLYDYYFERVDLPEVEETLPQSVRDFREARGLVDPPVSDHRTRVARATYYALTELMDRNIGQVLAALESNGLAENTLVIYLSDHGDLIGEHGCWWKSMYYEGSVGVPAVIAGPGVVGGGREIPQLASLLDIGPTLFDIAQAKHVHSHDGISLTEALFSDTDYIDRDRTVLSEMVDIRRDAPPIASRMARQGPWKIWRTFDDRGFSPPTLFNLESDPEEKQDLGASLQHLLVRRRMLKVLEDGWTPDADRKAAAGLRADLMDVIQRYGRLVQPDCAETLPFPDDVLEKDVVLVEDTGSEGAL